jgi:hypothetical protein
MDVSRFTFAMAVAATRIRFRTDTCWGLRKHLKSHEKPFKCSIDDCSGAFARNSDLRRHDQSVHKREIKFWCTVSTCIQKEVGFSRKDHFMQHLATHSSSTALVVKPETLVSTTALRKKRRRSPSAEEQKKASNTDAQNEMLKLRAEVEMLRLRTEKLQETVYIQAGSTHALLSKKRDE